MALEAINILTQLSILLLIGILGTAFAHRFRVSNVLILLVAGSALGMATDFFAFESVFTVGLAVTALAMVVFEGTTKFSFRQLDIYSGPALQMTGWYLLLTTLLVGSASWFLLFKGQPSALVLSLVLTLSVAGTDPSSVVLILENATSKLTRMLTLEAVVNTPIMVLLPFIILDATVGTFGVDHLIEIVQQVVVGVGAGVVIGLILFKALRRYYAKDLSNVAVVAGALMSYLLADNLGGSGVLSVATLGIIFGNVTIKNKEELSDFSFAFSSVLEVLVFLIIGILIGGSLDYTWPLLLKTLAVFAVLFLARVAATWLVYREDYNWAERLFTAIIMPKGIAVAVLIFIFSSPLYPQVSQRLIDALFLVMVYSVVAATVAGWWWNTYEPAKDAK